MISYVEPKGVQQDINSGDQSHWGGGRIDDIGIQCDLNTQAENLAKKIDDANVGHENHEYLYNSKNSGKMRHSKANAYPITCTHFLNF